MRANGEHHGFEHARLRDISPAVRRTHRAFAVVRNPWARVVSRFAFNQRAVEQENLSQSYAATSFEEFLEERHIWGKREFYWHRAIRGWYSQLDYVIEEDGTICADILRTEYLDEEVCGYFNVQEQVGRRNVSQTSRDYREYYDRRTIQIVADWYAADIETFGFDFDTPATRNTYFAGKP